ncbi:SlyX family protein [Flocculibacter collagenilyticus]|uniref:SlyX family protein n=1 Tax=Flocculibacter collagenilyticus TaxID=2744479 RepID=UPI001F433284|nr:SlyX family protein [Flocculibacter collagenilyticus]
MSEIEQNKLEQRIEELESKLAFQDDTINQLNDEIAHHQEKLQLLQKQIELLGKKFKETHSSTITTAEEEPPPPHY